jgi:hypothetical protein
MKFTTIYLGENKIEVFNSLLGRETIKVNGEIVSQKYSIFGAEHNFIIKENEESVEYKIDFGFGFNGVVFDLYRNSKPIVESPKMGCMFFVIIVMIALVVGLIGSFF